jgi:hypothetical protein
MLGDPMYWPEEAGLWSIITPGTAGETAALIWLQPKTRKEHRSSHATHSMMNRLGEVFTRPPDVSDFVSFDAHLLFRPLNGCDVGDDFKMAHVFVESVVISFSCGHTYLVDAVKSR